MDDNELLKQIENIKNGKTSPVRMFIPQEQKKTGKYAEYLRSPHWQTMKRLAIEHAQGRCQVCNRTEKLQVHHRTYERLGRERLDDLTVLCDGCHDLFESHKIIERRPA